MAATDWILALPIRPAAVEITATPWWKTIRWSTTTDDNNNNNMVIKSNNMIRSMNIRSNTHSTNITPASTTHNHDSGPLPPCPTHWLFWNMQMHCALSLHWFSGNHCCFLNMFGLGGKMTSWSIAWYWWKSQTYVILPFEPHVLPSKQSYFMICEVALKK